jgi:hypothetical protein
VGAGPGKSLKVLIVLSLSSNTHTIIFAPLQVIDSISVVNIVLAVGLSIDYSAHIGKSLKVLIVLSLSSNTHTIIFAPLQVIVSW